MSIFSQNKNNQFYGCKSCYRCGREGHLENECYAKNDVVGNIINDYFYVCEICNSEFECEADFTKHEKICQKIFQKTFNKIKCKYCTKYFDTLKGATYHENFYCKQKLKN
jgi:hypothetical protein